ncbi:MAG: Cupredoxin-like domain [Thermoplasmata archaeon]|jgi:MYXO-CTERM domain-containing protein|nr:Cupredoxin-like domain [Thermoplasmata archaeon]
MRARLGAGLALAAVAAALAATPLAGAHSEPNTFHVTAHDLNGQFWFTFEGIPGRNPSVVLQPNTAYTFEVRNDGTMQHDFHVGDKQVARLLNKGESATGTFTTDADGVVEYFCAPHQGVGMKGRMPVGTGSTDNGAPAPAALLPLALVGAALVRRRTA